MKKLLLVTAFAIFAEGALASSTTLIEGNSNQEVSMINSHSESEEFLSKTPKDFPEAIAMMRALLRSEVEFYSAELKQCHSINYCMYCAGFKIVAEGLLKNVNEIDSLRLVSDDVKAKKIRDAFLRIEEINKKAEAAFNILNPEDNQTRKTLSQFILEKLISPFLVKTVAITTPVDRNSEDWIPDHIKSFNKKQKSRNAVRKKRGKREKTRNRGGQDVKSFVNSTPRTISEIKVEESMTSMLPILVTQNTEVIVKEEPKSVLVETPINVRKNSSQSRDVDSRNLRNETPEIKVEEAMTPILPILVTQNTEVIVKEEPKSVLIETPINVRKNSRQSRNVGSRNLRNETPEMAQINSKQGELTKIEVSKDSWDTMVKLRKLKDQPLNKGELNGKISVINLFNLIREIGGIVAPGGKTNLNLAIPSLSAPNSNKWESMAMHRLHGDRSRFLPTDTLSWGNRIKRLLEDANIGPETLVSK